MGLIASYCTDQFSAKFVFQNFAKSYENKLKSIFDQWPKLKIGFWIRNLKFKSYKLSIRQAKLLAVTTAVLNRIIVFFLLLCSSTRIFLIFCFGFLSLPSSLFCSPFDQNFFVWLDFFHIVIKVVKEEITFCFQNCSDLLW